MISPEQDISFTLVGGDLQLTLLALSFNAWTRVQLDYGTSLASVARDVEWCLTRLPEQLQRRALYLIYGKKPASYDNHDNLGKPSYHSSGLSGFTESGTPSSYDTAAGSVIGYRQWSISHGDLVGANGIYWLPPSRVERVNRTPLSCLKYSGNRYIAECTSLGNCDVPNERGCGCGFWAYWLPETVKNGSYHHFPVSGVIQGSGKVILGEHGFRSQYAVLRGLAVNEESSKHETPEDVTRTVDVLKRYSVPVYNSMELMADDIGTDPLYSPVNKQLGFFTGFDYTTLLRYQFCLLKILQYMHDCNNASFHDCHDLDVENKLVEQLLTNHSRQPIT